MTTPQDVKSWIEQNLPGAEVETSGDGRHFDAVVIYADFAGHNMLARHRMVYDALADRMKQDIHALSLKTLTPEEVV